MAEEKTKVGWRLRNDKLDRLGEIKKIKNNQLKISGAPELKDADIVEMAIDELYFKVMSISKDRDTNERLSNMIDNKINVSYGNIESANADIQRQLLKDHKLIDLMASLIFPNLIDKLVKLTACGFDNNKQKASDYIMNKYIPDLIKKESIYSELIEKYIENLNEHEEVE